MKELSVNEMESISGAYSWDFSSLGSAISCLASNSVEAVASTILLSAITAGGGSIIGGCHGSDNGGIFGVGTIGMMIGGAYGIVAGAIAGAAAGLFLGWENSKQVAIGGIEAIYNGTTGFY
ncbi:hypothetical protein AB9D95_12645 [Klebsiella africana]|uniref:hypothetical protein n=1 Tax=Klebsiella africana TaxID=2489010 RepID=UPI0019339FDE|nr:hypothetical protein [Klebsiella africana]QRF12254.1 hypothetical protein H1X61_23130 [Klebsiella africana]